MDDKTQKERLEQELRFLKESFEAEVISKEEFEKGKDRIGKKLDEIVAHADEPNNASQQAAEKQDEQKQKSPEAAEEKESEKIKLKVIHDEPEEHLQVQPQKTEQKITEETAAEKPKPEYIEEKKGGRFFKYATILIILALIIYFSYSSFKGSEPQQKINAADFVAACNSNSDCNKEGRGGICVLPGTENAKCEFVEIQKTNVLVINDRKNCFNCDTQRVLGILENWFGNINANEIDYNTEIGMSIAERFSLNMLPAYIMDGNITKNPGFEKFKQAFTKKDDNRLLNDDAAGSSFYHKRTNIQNKLDLFVILGDEASTKAENNLKEFLNAFKEVKFEKHFADDALTKELNIKSFPTFLINNKVRFSGIHAAETIKENFCQLNKLPECENSLSKSLV
ncbi:hypothetical protein HYW20_04785 [Candidatus Woesearchaeota archaeon]|nr:hypothetical protein [Candidatus Woesearchaeota archaeon]